MTTEGFQPGDTVRLKSGGPVMTVQTIQDNGVAICIWFEGKKRQSHTFMASTLEKAEPSRAGSARVIRG